MTALLALPALAFLVNRRAPTTRVSPFEPDFHNIRCPRCAWRPTKHDRWCCAPGCGHEWNTFATAGICPECAKTWHDTACLVCREWSPHEDWYESSAR